MNNVTSKQNKDLERLINITQSIYRLYCEKSKSKNPNQVNEYLNLAIEIENEIYQSLNINKKNCDELIIQFSNLLNRKDKIPDEEKNEIATRVENCFINIIYGYPFTSTKEDQDERINEDSTIIRNQIINEYHNTLICYLLDTANKTKSKNERKKFLNIYNMVLYKYKNLENIKHYEKKNEGREKCILFNHQKNLVDSIYKDFLFSTIEEVIGNCLIITDTDLETHKYRIEQNILIQFLKSGLYLLNEEEINTVQINLENNFLNNKEFETIKTISSQTTSKIMETIKEYSTEKKKNYTKQKI